MTDEPPLNSSQSVDGEDSSPGSITKYNTSTAEDQQEKPAVPSSIIESDKDIKAREKCLRVAQAVAPPPPSMSSLFSEK